jgi:hypothetical protein
MADLGGFCPPVLPVSLRRGDESALSALMVGRSIIADDREKTGRFCALVRKPVCGGAF